MTQIAHIRPDSIVLAREARGYTQKELADRIGVEQGTISKIEKGLLEPSEKIMQFISNELHYPLTFFYEQFFRVKGHYRKKNSLPVAHFKSCEAKMTITEKHFTVLHDAVELIYPNIPSWDVVSDGSPQMAAIHVRESWRAPKGRIENLTKLVENKGIIIIQLDLGDLDALSTFSETNYPIIFVNKRRTADRIRFNIAHELAHFVLHWGKIVSEDRDIEEEANDFASELLMPTKDIEQYLTRLNFDKLTELKSYWKTSMKAIVYKARKLNLMTKDQYYYLLKQFSALGYSKGEPELFPPEKPTFFNEILSLYINDLGYSKTELADLLKINVEELDSLYFDSHSIFFKRIRVA